MNRSFNTISVVGRNRHCSTADAGADKCLMGDHDIGEQKDQVWFDAVLYAGEPMDFVPEAAGPLILSAGLEILASNESMATQSPVVVDRGDSTVEAHWLTNLRVVAPAVEG